MSAEENVGAKAGDVIFEVVKTAGKGVATAYLGPAGGILVEQGANQAKKEIEKATRRNAKKSHGAKQKTAQKKQNSEIRVSFDPVKKEISVSNQEEDNTGARPRIFLSRPRFSYTSTANQPSAVLPGKPNPIEYGAILRNGQYIWPRADSRGNIRSQGRAVKRSVAIANYQRALRSWNARNAVYAKTASSRGVDAAARLAARAAASRMAALENRISELETQIQEIGTEASDWSEEDAYYEQYDSYEPGAYFDDDGFYGEFDGMSGDDGDLGYVRRYGRYPRPVGQRFESQYRPSTYYSQNYSIIDPWYGVYLDDFLMGPDDDIGADDDDGTQGADDDGTHGADDDDGTHGADDDVTQGADDDMSGATHVDLDGSGDQNLGDVDGDIGRTIPRRGVPQRGGVPQRRGVPQRGVPQRGSTTNRNRFSNVPPAPRRQPKFLPQRPPQRDHRDVIIDQLKQQIVNGKLDVAVLSAALKQGGHIIKNATRRGEQIVYNHRRVDGLAGEDSSTRQLPPPPPPGPSNLGGNDDDFPSAVNLSGSSDGGPPRPPPAPSEDELSGNSDCLPCGRISNVDE